MKCQRRIPSAEELKRLPAGDRGPRLRSLAGWHRSRLAAFEAAGSPNGISRHRRALRMLGHVAAHLGIQDLGA